MFHTNIHVRLAALKSSGIVPVRLGISRRTLHPKSLLDRVLRRARPRKRSPSRPQERLRKDSHCVNYSKEGKKTPTGTGPNGRGDDVAMEILQLEESNDLVAVGRE
jgi:hypothetical protein